MRAGNSLAKMCKCTGSSEPWLLAARCECDELYSNIQTPNQLKQTILINYYVCVDYYRSADLIIPIIVKQTNYTLLYLWAEIV